MMKKDKPGRDEFMLSHGCMRTVASFVSVPAMPTNRLRQDLAGQNRDVREKKWRLWMPRRFRVV